MGAGCASGPRQPDNSHRTVLTPVAIDPSQKVRLNKATSRVVIIGAGPAGLHMAAELQKRGVQNVTVLERSARSAGKVETRPSNGAIHEMGACWLATSYSYVREAIREYDVETREKGAGTTYSRDVILDPEKHVTVRPQGGAFPGLGTTCNSPEGDDDDFVV
jgi:pyruvate/2-oxoglutarate dehydrogenase complex dihydrolipoamide dehydrogenase (E3) component